MLTNHVTLAGTLRDSYDKSLGYLFSSAVGSVITGALALGAVVLACLLIYALFAKARGSQSAIVGRMASDGKKIIMNVVFIVLLLGPATWFPWIASGFDLLIQGIGQFMQHYFNW